MCQHNAAFYSAFFALLIAFVDIIPCLLWGRLVLSGKFADK